MNNWQILNNQEIVSVVGPYKGSQDDIVVERSNGDQIVTQRINLKTLQMYTDGIIDEAIAGVQEDMYYE